MAYTPSPDELRLAPPHIVHDIRRLRQAFDRPHDAMSWTAWYVYCRNVMDFFESRPNQDDILATHYLDDVRAAAWCSLVQQNKPPGYDEYREHVNKLTAHLTYSRVAYEHAAEGREYEPSRAITDYLLALSHLFFDRLSDDRKLWFGGLFR